MMKYRGYVASVEFDDSADILHGRVFGNRPYPLATFEATSTRQLRREFKRSVDEYLRWCEEDGVAPAEPLSGTVHINLGAELHAAVVRTAMAKHMSINSWIVATLQCAAQRRPNKAGKSLGPAPGIQTT